MKASKELTSLTLKIMTVLKSIPPGFFASYGQVAEMAGSPRGARQVVRILNSCSEKYELPWHRVVNSRGQIALRDPVAAALQRSLLEAEGALFTDAFTLDPACRYMDSILEDTHAAPKDHQTTKRQK